MLASVRILLLLLGGICSVQSLLAQLPFYTDDPAVTERGKLHFEFFDEFDGLQSSQYPNLRQNTANFKLNYGLPYRLEWISMLPIFRLSARLEHRIPPVKATPILESNGTSAASLGRPIFRRLA
jgi:hypothetical protein